MDHLTFDQLLGSYREFVGAIASVVTLGYLAVQVRHSREATEANTRSLRLAARFEAGKCWTEEAIRLALSPDMASIVATGFEDASRLDGDHRQRCVAWNLQHFFMAEMLYQQYVEGVLPEDIWRTHERIIVGTLHNEACLRLWHAGCLTMSRGFRDYLNRLRANMPSGSWSWEDNARLFDDLGPPQESV